MNRTSTKLVIGLVMLMAVSVVMSFKIADSGFNAPASADSKVNPLKGDAAATAAGKKLYDINCSICHGAKGQGDGVAAAGLSKPPANHTTAAVQGLSDGALFWKITEGKGPMPSYKAIYNDTQRWQLVNYIRTLAKKK